MRGHSFSCVALAFVVLAGMVAMSPACGTRGTDQPRGGARVETAASPAIDTSRPQRDPDPHKNLRQFARSAWRSQDGLPQNTVQAIIQRRDRYIWVATQEGVARFDGVEFEVFDRTNLPGLPHNDITALCEVGADQMWVGTAAGQVVLLTGGQARNFEALRGLPNRGVTSLVGDEGGGLWIGLSALGLGYFNGATLTLFDERAGLPTASVRALHLDRAGVLWVGTTGGLAHLTDRARGSFADVPALRGRRVQALETDDAGTVWVGTADGLVALSNGASRTYRVKDGLSSESVWSLQADRFGNLWIGTTRGLNRLRDGRIDWIDEAMGLTSDIVLSLLIDYEGSVWAGTDAGGLNQLREPSVAAFENTPGESSTFYTVASSGSGGAWAGTYVGGISRFDGRQFTPVLSPQDTGGGRVRALYEDSRGVLWIGTDRVLLSYKNGRVAKEGGRRGLPSGPTRAIGEDQVGVVWVGVDGAGLFQLASAGAVRYGPDRGMPAADIRVIYRARNGELWVGSYGGLSVLRDGRFLTFAVKDGLSHDYVRALTEDETGAMWVGTYGGGLTRIANGVYSRYSDLDGLPSNNIYSVQDDGRGHIWLSCNRGMFMVAREDLDRFAAGQIPRIQSVGFTEADGMRSRECNGGSPAACRLGDGRLAFPTLDGLAVVDPAALRPDSIPPAVLLQRVVADGVGIDPGAGRVFPAHPQRLEFHFVGLSYLAPELVRFRYMLEGFDRGWVDAGTTRLAQYTRLPPGAYRFRVAAANRDGVWSATDAEYHFEVHPAFYERTSVRLVALAALALVGITWYQWRLARRRHNARVLQQRIDEAVAQVKILRGLLPICAHCKKIRDDGGYWNRIEEYLREHSEITFSHGLCPECIRTLYPEIDLTEVTGVERSAPGPSG